MQSLIIFSLTKGRAESWIKTILLSASSVCLACKKARAFNTDFCRVSPPAIKKRFVSCNSDFISVSKKRAFFAFCSCFSKSKEGMVITISVKCSVFRKFFAHSDSTLPLASILYSFFSPPPIRLDEPAAKSINDNGLVIAIIVIF